MMTASGGPVFRTSPALLPVPGRRHLNSHRDRLPASASGAPPLPGGPSTGSASDPHAAPRSAAAARLDAVLVPAYRSLRHLRAAAGVAAQTRAALVLLCSGGVEAGAAARWFGSCGPGGSPPAVTVLAIDVRASGPAPAGYPGLVTSRFGPGRRWGPDTHLKRNLGILLARLLGWRRILFHNDDVSGLGGADLARTLALLEDPCALRRAAGWAFRDFPDNSVVCHAHRHAGGAQDTFISDAALALDATEPLPFFPGVYNEDWLFLQPMLRRGEVALAGDWLSQEAYRPFADPRRAGSEEFGDVLGEGLLRLEHLAAPLSAALEPDYWREELACRKRLILQIDELLPDDPERERIRLCLKEALCRHRDDWPQQLAGYVRDWQEDLDRWQQAQEALPSGLEPAAALERLGLAGERRGPAWVVGTVRR